MVDFHTHILPSIDDGSKSVEESISMLTELKEQGVRQVILTPHFYADRSSPSDFFKRRQGAWDKLKPHLTSELPSLSLGAEVRYFDGMNRSDEIERFCIEGTSLLLIEMPSGTWTRRMITALTELHESQGMTVLLAHIERYWKHQTRSVKRELLDSGIRMQLSAEYLIDRRTRRAALKMLRTEAAHVLGSDCHNMSSRKPNMAAAADIIRRKLGCDILSRIDSTERQLLRGISPVDTLTPITEEGGGRS